MVKLTIECGETQNTYDFCEDAETSIGTIIMYFGGMSGTNTKNILCYYEGKEINRDVKLSELLVDNKMKKKLIMINKEIKDKIEKEKKKQLDKEMQIKQEKKNREMRKIQKKKDKEMRKNQKELYNRRDNNNIDPYNNVNPYNNGSYNNIDPYNNIAQRDNIVDNSQNNNIADFNMILDDSYYNALNSKDKELLMNLSFQNKVDINDIANIFILTNKNIDETIQILF